MQWSSVKRVMVAFGASAAALGLAILPQHIPAIKAAFVDATPSALAQEQTKEQLEAQIAARNAQLRDVQAKLDAARSKLNSTSGQRKTLQSEVNRLEANIDELELGIEEDRLTVERLGFELTSLGNDVETLRDRMKDKQGTIAALLVEVQKSEAESPLITLLGADSLSDTIREAHSIAMLQGRVGSDLADLRGIQVDVLGKIDTSAAKRSEAEQRQLSLATKRELIADQQASKAKVLAATKNQESVFQAQVSALAAEQKKIAAETEAIEAALRAKINPQLLPTSGKGVLGMAVDGRISQGYGSTAFAQTGYAGKRHNGIDIAAPIGTPIYASADGTVVAAGNQDAYCPRGAYGRFTVITHPNGLTTLYAHQSKQVVAAGQVVKRGQLIGYVGTTGYATGPHLHFTVYATPTFAMGGSRVCGPMPQGGDVNPFNYL